MNKSHKIATCLFVLVFIGISAFFVAQRVGDEGGMWYSMSKVPSYGSDAPVYETFSDTLRDVKVGTLVQEWDGVASFELVKNWCSSPVSCESEFDVLSIVDMDISKSLISLWDDKIKGRGDLQEINIFEKTCVDEPVYSSSSVCVPWSEDVYDAKNDTVYVTEHDNCTIAQGKLLRYDAKCELKEVTDFNMKAGIKRTFVVRGSVTPQTITDWKIDIAGFKPDWAVWNSSYDCIVNLSAYEDRGLARTYAFIDKSFNVSADWDTCTAPYNGSVVLVEQVDGSWTEITTQVYNYTLDGENLMTSFNLAWQDNFTALENKTYEMYVKYTDGNPHYDNPWKLATTPGDNDQAYRLNNSLYSFIMDDDDQLMKILRADDGSIIIQKGPNADHSVLARTSDSTYGSAVISDGNADLDSLFTFPNDGAVFKDVSVNIFGWERTFRYYGNGQYIDYFAISNSSRGNLQIVMPNLVNGSASVFTDRALWNLSETADAGCKGVTPSYIAWYGADEYYATVAYDEDELGIETYFTANAGMWMSNDGACSEGAPTNNRTLRFGFMKDDGSPVDTEARALANMTYQDLLYPVVIGKDAEWVPNAVPTAPVWNYPNTNGTTVSQYSYVVNWTNSTDINGDALTYYLDLSVDDDFSTFEYTNASIVETASPTGDTLSGLTAGTIYARVRANDGIDNSSWTSISWVQTSTNVSVVLNVPASALNSTVSHVVFNCSGSDTDDNIMNISLIIDDAVNYTVTGSANTLTLEYNNSLAGSAHTWTCNATNVNNEVATATKRSLTIDPVDAEIGSPADGLNSTNATIDFGCWGNSTNDILNITFFLDGIVNYTETGITTTSGSLNVTRTLSGSVHDWSCMVYDVDGFNETTANRSLTIDPVDLDLNVPVADYNSTSSSVTFNCTANSTALLENITLVLDGVNNYSLTGITTNSRSISTTQSLTEGAHDWTCLAFDVNGFNETATARGLSVDSTLPVINVTSYNTTLATYSVPVNVTVNWTVTDTNLADSWISYDQNNYTGVGSAGSYGLSFGLNASRSHLFYVYANDTYGNLNRTFLNVSVYYIQFNLSENLDPITEGQTSVLTLILNTSSIPSTTARLVWNNTDYGLGTRTKTGTDIYTFTKSFTIPGKTGNSTGNMITYYWNYTMIGVVNDSLVSNQSVVNFLFGLCNSTYPLGLLNYSLYDEETQSSSGLTNISIAVDLLLSSADGSFSWNFSTNTTENNLSICISNLTNGSSLRLSSVAQYSSDLHEIEFHYIQDFNVTRSNHTQTIKLFDLATADSTSFLVTFKDTTHLPVENAIIDAWRYYVAEGRYKSVEHGKTNDQGETVLHLVTEDVIYNFYVRKDQELLWVSPDYQVLCQTTPCQLNFIQSGGFLDIPDFTTVDNLDYTIDLNRDARTVTLTYSVTDGSNSKVDLTVTKLDAYMNDTVCEETETSSGGTLTCTIPTTYANDTYLIELYNNDAFAENKLFNIDISFGGFGHTGTLLTAMLYLTLVLMVAGNPIIAIVMGIFGLVVASTLMIFGGGAVFGRGSAILWIICAAGILIYKMANRSRN